MRAILSDILDYSIETNNISVVNDLDGSVYFIPYDGAGFDAILDMAPQIKIKSALNSDDNIDMFNFTISCQYSHIGPDRNLFAKYELYLGDTLLFAESAPILAKLRAKPRSLLRTARKCANKIIAQERAALQFGMIKTLQTDSVYDS